MNVRTHVDVREIPRIRRDTDARELAHAAYDQLLAQLDRLDPQDWETVTECAPWTVADMVGHLIGAARSHASVREFARQQLHGVRHRGEFDGNALDATNALQVRDHRHLSPTERVDTLRTLAPRAVRGRMRTPAPIRRIAVSMDQGGSLAAGSPSTINLGHLMDAVLTRDVWLHRVDIALATGRPVDVDTDTDRRIVADIVAEWASRHGRAFTLDLTGPAGGRFRQGSGGEELSLDAVRFCRVLSGREPADGLLRTRVLF